MSRYALIRRRGNQLADEYIVAEGRPWPLAVLQEGGAWDVGFTDRTGRIVEWIPHEVMTDDLTLEPRSTLAQVPERT
jgi:hypothetical protein